MYVSWGWVGSLVVVLMVVLATGCGEMCGET